jgi:hypothetical protein
MAVFKKGDLVTLIADWDCKGTVYYQQAVVFSCGKKQMILTHEKSGEELGRHFRPELGSLEMIPPSDQCYGWRQAGGVFPRMTPEQAVVSGLKVAESIQNFERWRIECAIKSGGSDINYVRAMRQDLDALHELSVIER